MNYAVLPNIFLPPVSFNTIETSGQIKLANGTVSNPSLTFVSDTDTGIYHSAANTISLTSNASEIARCSATANIVKMPFSASTDFTGAPSNSIVLQTDGANTALRLVNTNSGGGYMQIENPNGDIDLRIGVSSANDVIFVCKNNALFTDETFAQSVVINKAPGNGISIKNPGITNYVASNLTAYMESTLPAVNLLGFSVVTTCSLQFTRTGNMCCLTVSSVNLTSSGITVECIAGSFPEPFRPQTTLSCCIPVTKENAVPETGSVAIGSNGSLVFAYTPSSSWGILQANSGWNRFSVTYHV